MCLCVCMSKEDKRQEEGKDDQLAVNECQTHCQQNGLFFTAHNNSTGGEGEGRKICTPLT